MTIFERKVLRAVLNIPLGETRTYQEIARSIHHPGASRAVGTVLRKNQYPVLIPCHRVVKSSGDTGEYSGTGGKRRKAALLRLEREIAQFLYMRKPHAVCKEVP